MGTYTLKQYRQVQVNRIKALKRSMNRSSLSAAKFHVLQAKRLAPRLTGETVRGIRKRKLSNARWISESIVSAKGQGFRQNMWANRSPPYHNPRMVWNRRKPTFYGQGHNATGFHQGMGFFDKATQLTRRQFGRVFRRNTIKAIRVSI